MRAIIASAMLVALCMTATPASSLSLREENRAILMAEDSPMLYPYSMVRVTRTVGEQVESTMVTRSTAIELELDYLEARGIRLSDGGSAAASGANPQPAWPALGTFTVRETGFYSLGARCPTAVLAAPAPTLSAYNQVRGTNVQSLGVYETSISESWEKTNADGTRSTYGSSMTHQPLDGSASTTYRYGRDAPTPEGWTLRFAFEAGIAPGSSFFCREETLSANGVDRVRLTGQFFPFADRIDD